MPKASLNVKGKTIQELLDMDVSSLNKADLKRVSSRLVSASNKRLRRLEEKGFLEYSYPAKNVINEYPKGFSTVGKNANQLRHMIKSMRSFLNAETSSVRGFTKVRNDVRKRVGDFPDIETEKKFWKEYNKFVKDQKALIRASNIDSTQLQKLLHQRRVVKNQGLYYARKMIKKYLNTLYEEEQSGGFNGQKGKSDIQAKDVFHIDSDF